MDTACVFWRHHPVAAPGYTNEAMVIQLDIDDTITWAPAFFAWMSHALMRDGHRVRIVTARGRHSAEPAQTEMELRALGITWDELILSEAVPEIDRKELPPDFPEDLVHLWPKCRATMKDLPDLVFDDSVAVSALFSRYLPDVRVIRPLRADSNTNGRRDGADSMAW